MVANGWGRIIGISSVLAGQPAVRMAAAAASKAGMEAFLLAVAQEAKSKGVTANILVVRTIDTP